MNYALLAVARQSRSKRALFFFFSGEEGALLRLRLVTASRPTYEASPSFASCYALATAKSRPSPKPSPTPLHVKGGDATLLMQSVAGFKFAFSRCWSRRIKFEAGSYKFNFKFEHKAIRRRIFLLRCARSFPRSSRRGALKFGDGSYLVGNDRAKFKSLCLQLRVQRSKATYRAKRQAAISRDGFLLRYARNAKARKGFASLAVATASRSEVKI